MRNMDRQYLPRLIAELWVIESVVGRELEGRAPSRSLRVGLGDQVVRVLERAREIARERLRCTVEVVLCAVVIVHGWDVKK